MDDRGYIILRPPWGNLWLYVALHLVLASSYGVLMTKRNPGLFESFSYPVGQTVGYCLMRGALLLLILRAVWLVREIRRFGPRGSLLLVSPERIVKASPKGPRTTGRWKDLTGYSPAKDTLWFRDGRCMKLTYRDQRVFSEADYEQLAGLVPQAAFVKQARDEFSQRRARRQWFEVVGLILGWILMAALFAFLVAGVRGAVVGESFLLAFAVVSAPLAVLKFRTLREIDCRWRTHLQTPPPDR